MSAERDGFARFVKHFSKGTVLFNEDDPGEEMYIIRSGRVAIRKRIPDQGDIVVAELEKGDFFGEMAVLERIPRTAGAEMLEDGDLIVIGSDIFGDMVKANPEIAVRMLRKYSLRLRETTKQVEQLKKLQSPDAQMLTMERVVVELPKKPTTPAAKAGGAEPLAYFVSKSTGNVFPVLKAESLIGRFDSVTGQSPEIDLTHEDNTRNISRRHARLVLRDGEFLVAEEIGTMNGTYVNGQRLTTGVLMPLKDGDELTLCRLGLVFRLTPPNA
jgi:CRP-like cAMP-binding protein